MSKKKKALIFAVLTVLATLFIFGNSLQIGEESAKQSGFFADILKKVLNFAGFDPDYDTVSLIIRKGAHFTEYFILSALAAGTIYFGTEKRAYVFFAPVYAFLTAICDEFICQALTEGRGPQWKDVMIDTSGALLAAVIIFIIIKNSKHKKHNNPKS